MAVKRISSRVIFTIPFYLTSILILCTILVRVKSLIKIPVKRRPNMAEVLLSPHELITSTKAAARLPRLLDALSHQRWFIQRRGKIEGVLISLEEYKRLLALMETLEHLTLGRLIEERERTGVEEYLDLDDVLQELGIEA